MGQKKTLLIVDDVEMNRELLRSIVSEEYDTIMAEDGKQGISVLRENCNQIAAVILDIQMPVMDGFEFLKVVSNDDVLKSIPVIVTTILDKEGAEERCLKLGAADFIVRPFCPTIVLARIKNILRLKESKNTIQILESESQIDLLTGFKNRRGFYKDGKRLKQRDVNQRTPLGVLYVDINGLKRVNDLEGHTAGDNLIVSVATKIKKIFGNADAYRLGGDEFLILEKTANKEEFYKKAIQLSNCWGEQQTVALGYVWLEDSAEIDEAIMEADKKMYLDKNKYYQKRSGDRRDFIPVSDNKLLNYDCEWLEHLPGAFLISSVQEETLLAFNQAFIQILECQDAQEVKQFLGDSVKEIVHLEDWNTIQKNRTENPNEISHFQYRVKTKNNNFKQVQCECRYVKIPEYGDVYYQFLTQRIDSSERVDVKE